MKDQLSLTLEPEVAAFLSAEAGHRGITVEELGRFAIDLFVHYRAQTQQAAAVILQPAPASEPSHHMLYASSVPRELGASLDAIIHDERTESYRLRATTPPVRLYVVE